MSDKKINRTPTGRRIVSVILFIAAIASCFAAVIVIASIAYSTDTDG